MKGVSSLVSMALYVAIVLAAVTIVVNVALPTFDRMQDSAAIQSNINFLTEMDEVIRDVASGTQGAARTVTLTFQRGSYHFNSSREELYYQIETRSSIISSHAVQQRGAVTLSADADVSVKQREANNVTCYMMENDHLKACIRKVPKSFNASDHGDLMGFWQLDEGSGQWANDSSQNNNSGKLGGTAASGTEDPSWTTGIHNDGLDFDGSNDEVNVSDSSSLSGPSNSGQVTVTAWINPDSASNSDAGIVSKAGTWSSDISYAMTYHTDGNVYFYINSGSNSCSSTVSQGKWRYFAGTYDGNEIKCYVNGSLVDTTSYSSSINSNGNALQLGNRLGNSHFDGQVDEVRVYNRSLSNDEIEWLYLKEGDEEYVNTSKMLVKLRNKELGENLNATLSSFINGNSSMESGTGFTTADTGRTQGRGRVTLNLTNGDSYRLAYDLLTGADFLALRTAGTAVDNATHHLDMVLDSRTGDDKYIDNQQRSQGVYTSGEVGFGYAAAENSGRVAGLVPGGNFIEVGYDSDTGKGFYGFNLTTSRDAVFLPFTEDGHGVIEERKNEIQGDIFGSGGFLGFPRPNFAYSLTREKTVKAALTFENVVMNGFDRVITQGTYDITVSNEGVQNGQAVVNLTVD